MHPFFDPQRRSLARGNVLVLASVGLAFWLSDFPNSRATLWLLVPTVLVLAGTVDTARCIQRRYTLYHGGVILSLYMDLMATALVLFALLYPWVQTFNPRH